jgi:N utilization substance protein B
MVENFKINGRSFARFFAVQILFTYQYNNNEGSLTELMDFLEDYYISDEVDDYKNNINFELLNILLSNELKNNEEIENIIKDNLDKKFDFDKLDCLVKAIFKLAIYEMKFTSLDRKVIINEYVDIAGEYMDIKGIAFVNANLDKINKNIN